MIAASFFHRSVAAAIQSVTPLSACAWFRDLPCTSNTASWASADVPEFEGVTNAKHMSDWDPPFPVDPKKVKLITDAKQVLAHVVTLKAEEVVADPAAAAAATAPAEPEVIKKGKKEEEGDGEAEAGGKEAAAPKAEKSEKKK